MERDSKGVGPTVAIGVAICISLVAMLAVFNRKDQTVGLKQEIQYDDFAFAVQGIRPAATVGVAVTDTTRRGYWVVTLQIANHAKRVDFNFKKSTAILVDEQGREYHTSETAQQVIGLNQTPACTSPIPAGSSCTTELAFELPEGAHASTFRVSEGGRLGDVLDSIFYGNKRITLGSLQ
jgi:hypothetical protein